MWSFSWLGQKLKDRPTKFKPSASLICIVDKCTPNQLHVQVLEHIMTWCKTIEYVR